MAIGRTAFRRVQISNPENSPGTAEAAIEILICKFATSYFDKVIHQPEADRNSLSMNHADDLIVANDLEIELEGDFHHRLALWLFSNAIRGNITPTQPDATNKPLEFLYNFQPGIQTANTPDITAGVDTFTLELGDNVQDYEAEFLIATTITLSGQPDGVVEFSWTAKARQLTETTLTEALVETIPQRFATNKVKFYIDDSYAGIGGTQQLDLLSEWEWTLETGFTVRQTADGDLFFTGVSEDKKNVELKCKYVRGAGSEAEKVKADARTTTYIRVEIIGNNEIDIGQANPPTIQLDGAFRAFDWDAPDSTDGTEMEEVTYQSVLDATASLEYEVNLFTDMDGYPA